MSKTTFQSKEKRDAEAKRLVAAGHRVRRYSMRGQLLHPMYIADYEGPLDTGLGNTQYRTYWPVLYMVEIVRY